MFSMAELNPVVVKIPVRRSEGMEQLVTLG
jgi:hypothetical protein